jgi:cation transport regulator ChaC
LTETAKQIVGAAGLLGTNLDYLDSTYHALSAYGIEDAYLENLLSCCRHMTGLTSAEMVP